MLDIFGHLSTLARFRQVKQVKPIATTGKVSFQAHFYLALSQITLSQWWGTAKFSSIIMVLMTMVARVADGLPLAASIQEDEQLGKNIVDYQNQAKRLFKTLTPTSPIKCSIESGQYLFQ